MSLTQRHTSPLSVLVVDDSAFYRELVAGILVEEGGVTIAGSAAGGRDALELLRTTPIDVVFCDVYMPELDGVATLKAIRESHPDVSVVMMSAISTRGAESTVRALEMGAIDFVRKPDLEGPNENRDQLRGDVRGILRLANVHRNTTQALRMVAGVGARSVPRPVPATAQPLIGTPKIVAIGTSTGGPEALSKLLPTIPETFPYPIVIVQHMPREFTAALAQSLDRKSAVHVVEAQEGEELTSGTAYVAPGGRHMTVLRRAERIVVGINDEPPVKSCRPSVDVLFRSVADVYPYGGIVAIVLTGMGDDGRDGVTAMKRGGCLCLAQSPESCVVWGMPRSIMEAGLADKVLTIEEIAVELLLIHRGPRGD